MKSEEFVEDENWIAVAASTCTEKVPIIFRNCTGYRCPTDAKYSACTVGFGNRDECDMLDWLHMAKDFRRYSFAIVPLVFSFISIVLNILFIWLIVALIIRNRKRSRKRYAFLINRSACTIIALCLFYAALCAWKLDVFNYISAMLFIGVAMLLFFNLTFTYLTMASLLYTAVVHPLAYRAHVTMKRSLVLIGVIWLIAGAASIGSGMLGATLFYPETAPISCVYASCQWPTAFALTVVLGALYLLVIVGYAAMMVRVHCRHPTRVQPLRDPQKIYSARSDAAKLNVKRLQLAQDTETASVATRRNLRLLRRLAWNLLTFTISKCPVVIILIIALVKLDQLRQLGIGKKNYCKTYNNGKLFFHLELLASSAANIWLLGLLFDPLINIVTDPPLWRFVRLRTRRLAAKLRSIVGDGGEKFADSSTISQQRGKTCSNETAEF